MALSKPAKTILGILTLLPFLWWVLLTSHLNDPAVIGWTLFSRLPALTIIMVLTVFGQAAFYIAWLWRHGRVTGWKRAMWTVALILFHAGALPVFFYVYAWRGGVDSSGSLAA